MSLLQFNTLKKNLKKDFTNFSTKINLSILGDSPTQFLKQAIKAYGFEKAIDYAIFEADIDQVEMQILDPSSELYEHQSDYILIFESVFVLKDKFYKSKDKVNFAQQYIDKINLYYQAISEQRVAKVLFFNFPDIDDAVFGNYANKLDVSFVYQLRKINYLLMEAAIHNSNLFIIDVASLYAEEGKELATARNMYISNGLVYSLDFTCLIAKKITDQILAISGRFNKCLILDLDNTTWGGIIGDDGIENIQIGDLGIGKAFSELQKWANTT